MANKKAKKKVAAKKSAPKKQAKKKAAKPKKETQAPIPIQEMPGQTMPTVKPEVEPTVDETPIKTKTKGAMRCEKLADGRIRVSVGPGQGARVLKRIFDKDGREDSEDMCAIQPSGAPKIMVSKPAKRIELTLCGDVLDTFKV